MKHKLGNYFAGEAGKINEGGHQLDLESRLHFLANRIAVIYYEGKADGLEEAHTIVHGLAKRKKEVEDAPV